jgi:uncharacterized protein (TIGR02452 family)
LARGTIPGVLSCGASNPAEKGEQERSLLEASNLSVSLSTKHAQKFYSEHEHGGNGALFSQVFILSPGVTCFRDGEGQWARPVQIDVVTATPVNVQTFKKASERVLPARAIARTVEGTMEDRMGRTLRIFERNGNRVLILSCFGAGEL